MKAPCQKAIFAAVKTAFDADGTLPKAVFPNVESAVAAGALHVKFSLAFGQTESDAVGALLERTALVLFAQVFIPANGGTLPASRVCDTLRTTFPIGSAVSFTNGSNAVTANALNYSGPASAGFRDGYEQQNITVTFRVDEIKG